MQINYKKRHKFCRIINVNQNSIRSTGNHVNYEGRYGAPLLLNCLKCRFRVEARTWENTGGAMGHCLQASKDHAETVIQRNGNTDPAFLKQWYRRTRTQILDSWNSDTEEREHSSWILETVIQRNGNTDPAFLKQWYRATGTQILHSWNSDTEEREHSSWILETVIQRNGNTDPAFLKQWYRATGAQILHFWRKEW